MSEQQEPTPPEPTPETTGETAAPPELPSKDARNMAMLAHLLGIFTSFIGPLIIWLIKKDEDRFVDNQGKEALNFQITLAIVYVVCTVTSCLVIPVFIMMAAGIAALVLALIAAVKASRGEAYRYPVALRLVK
ncbi:MAG: DUF4870 domain-containing protein [Phycisphaeraceae bacterium]